MPSIPNVSCVPAVSRCVTQWHFGHLFPVSPQPRFSPPDPGTCQLSGAVASVSVSDETITQTMARCWAENRYLLCPHSAVAVSYHYQQTDRQQPSPPRCCLAPASAAKFPEAVLAAGLTPETPAEILALEHKETRCTPMRKGDDWTWMLRDAIQDLSQQWRGHFPKALA